MNNITKILILFNFIKFNIKLTIFMLPNKYHGLHLILKCIFIVYLFDIRSGARNYGGRGD